MWPKMHVYCFSLKPISEPITNYHDVEYKEGYLTGIIKSEHDH